MGLREALWLGGFVLACYATWQFFRALRAPHPSASAPQAVPGREATRADTSADANADGDEDAFLDYAPLPAPQPSSAPAAPQSAAAGRENAQPDVFQLELDNSRLRQALQAQRDLVALQQGEIDRLVQDITVLQDELDRLREQPTASPEYSEAMVLAGQGLHAEMIASRCGITLAEAELVLSLARRGEGSA